jgi:hypothetical protein
MEKLIFRKQKVVEDHISKIAKENLNLMKAFDKAMRDRKLVANFDIGIFNKVKSMFSINKDEILSMNGDQRLELSKVWSEDAKSMLDIYRNDPGYQSFLKDIDGEIELHKEQLNLLTEELKKVEDEDMRIKLIEKRDGIIFKK